MVCLFVLIIVDIKKCKFWISLATIYCFKVIARHGSKHMPSCQLNSWVSCGVINFSGGQL